MVCMCCLCSDVTIQVTANMSDKWPIVEFMPDNEYLHGFECTKCTKLIVRCQIYNEILILTSRISIQKLKEGLVKSS